MVTINDDMESDTWQTTHARIDNLRSIFKNLIFSQYDNVNWRPRSCYLKPLYTLESGQGFILWNKSSNKSEPQGKNLCRCSWDKVRRNQNVLKNLIDRMGYWQISCGGYLIEIIFHKYKINDLKRFDWIFQCIWLILSRLFPSHRNFKAYIGSQCSPSIHIPAGCPQGSCLLPILYNLYTYACPRSFLPNIRPFFVREYWPMMF